VEAAASHPPRRARSLVGWLHGSRGSCRRLCRALPRRMGGHHVVAGNRRQRCRGRRSGATGSSRLWRAPRRAACALVILAPTVIHVCRRARRVPHRAAPQREPSARMHRSWAQVDIGGPWRGLLSPPLTFGMGPRWWSFPWSHQLRLRSGTRRSPRDPDRARREGSH